jgi:hypothetical protein
MASAWNVSHALNMEGAMQYRNVQPIMLVSAVTFACATGTVVGFVTDTVWFVLSCGVGTALGLIAMTGKCYRIDLRPDGVLVAHYPCHTRRIAIECIRAIGKHVVEDRDGDYWLIRLMYDGGTIDFDANRTTRRMAAALLQLNPRIAVSDLDLG